MDQLKESFCKSKHYRGLFDHFPSFCSLCFTTVTVHRGMVAVSRNGPVLFVLDSSYVYHELTGFSMMDYLIVIFCMCLSLLVFLTCCHLVTAGQGRRSLWDRGTRPPIFGLVTGGHYHECPPQYFWSNINYFLSMQYFLDKLKEFLV